MADAINELKEISTRLNEESDSINTILEKIESKLNNFKLGLEVWLETPLTVQDRSGCSMLSTQIEVQLGYTKANEGWGLAVRHVKVEAGCYESDPQCPWRDEFQLGGPEPLLKASRELRMAALKLLPNLVESLKKKTEATLDDIKQAKELVKNL